MDFMNLMRIIFGDCEECRGEIDLDFSFTSLNKSTYEPDYKGVYGEVPRLDDVV